MLDKDDESYLGVFAGAMVEGVPEPKAQGSPLEGRQLWKWVASFDRDRDLERLLQIVTESSTNQDAGSLYNRGCVRVRIGEYDEALEDLKATFEHVPSDAFARALDAMRADPTLNPLRKDDKYKLKFEQLLVELEERRPMPARLVPPSPAKADRWTVEILAT